MARTVSTFLPSLFSPCVGPHSQHWGNLILDLRDQHLGQHNACNLEDSSSHFRLQKRLFTLNSLCRASQGPLEGCHKAHLAQRGNVSKLDKSFWIVYTPHCILIFIWLLYLIRITSYRTDHSVILTVCGKHSSSWSFSVINGLIQMLFVRQINPVIVFSLTKKWSWSSDLLHIKATGRLTQLFWQDSWVIHMLPSEQNLWGPNQPDMRAKQRSA